MKNPLIIAAAALAALYLYQRQKITAAALAKGGTLLPGQVSYATPTGIAGAFGALVNTFTKNLPAANAAGYSLSANGGVVASTGAAAVAAKNGDYGLPLGWDGSGNLIRTYSSDQSAAETARLNTYAQVDSSINAPIYNPTVDYADNPFAAIDGG